MLCHMNDLCAQVKRTNPTKQLLTFFHKSSLHNAHPKELNPSPCEHCPLQWVHVCILYPQPMLPTHHILTCTYKTQQQQRLTTTNHPPTQV
jgi:hypothetical protein